MIAAPGPDSLRLPACAGCTRELCGIAIGIWLFGSALIRVISLFLIPLYAKLLMVLSNEFLEARFENGVLVNLSRPSGQNLLTGCFFKYSDGDGDISESPEEGARCLNVVEVQETGVG